VSHVLDVLAGEFPILGRRIRDETGALRRYVNVYVDGEDVRLLGGVGTEVTPGQELQILQSVAGG
jgi:molybdopterin converting factor small subunit